MLNSDALAFLAGVSSYDDAQASNPTNVHIISGEVVSPSEDGTVVIEPDGIVFSADDSQYIEMDTLGGLEEGDTATIILMGEEGQGMTPLALGSNGSVDRVVAQVNEVDSSTTTAIAELSDDMNSSLSGLEDSIELVKEDVGSIRNDIDEDARQRYQWLTFNGEEGLIIGARDVETEVLSDFYTQFTSTDINFMEGDEVLMNLNGTDGVNGPKITTDELHLGDWMWVARDNGNVSLKYNPPATTS